MNNLTLIKTILNKMRTKNVTRKKNYLSIELRILAILI